MRTFEPIQKPKTLILFDGRIALNWETVYSSDTHEAMGVFYYGEKETWASEDLIRNIWKITFTGAIPDVSIWEKYDWNAIFRAFESAKRLIQREGAKELFCLVPYITKCITSYSPDNFVDVREK